MDQRTEVATISWTGGQTAASSNHQPSASAWGDQMNNQMIQWLLDWYTINLQLFFLSKQKDKHYISNEKICRFSLISMINTWLFGGFWLLVDENKQYDINLCSPAFSPQSADCLRTIISCRPKITEALILHFLKKSVSSRVNIFSFHVLRRAK